MMRLLTFLLACLLAGSTLAQTQDRSNVVLILADDLGWVDTELIGETSLYETPNLKRLAERGMTFSNAYAASPICSPTRASILTGQTPARHGMTQPAGHVPTVRYEPETQASGPPHQKCTNVQSVTRLHPSLPTLGKVLKQAGYQTAHFGKWHLGREGHTPLEHGFDIDLPYWYGPGPKTSYLAPWGYTNPAFKEGEPGEHIEDRMAREAVTWLSKRDPAKPFFMNYWQFSVHAPFGAKPELIEHYRKKIKRGERQQSPTYAAMVHSLDDAVGTLLDALDKEGIAEKTVIVFYSDNGGNIHCGLEEADAKGEQYICPITSNHPLRGGKGGIHDGGIRIPAVVVWPGVTKGQTQSDTRIQSTDLYPTILSMLGVDLPKDHVIDGVDFTQALRGEAMDRAPMFTYAPYHGNTPQWLPPSMAVHHGDWKLIRTFHYGDNGEHAYRLYNLRDDIGERNNLAASKPEKVKELDRLITDYIAQAKVVVPKPNPKFDPAKYDPEAIGVQQGGLKMPPKWKPQGKPNAGPPKGDKPAARVAPKQFVGWSVRNGQAAVEGESLRLSPANANLLLTHAKLRADGPIQVKLRIKTPADATGKLQWRTEGQDIFPKDGQTKSFKIAGGKWQELSIPLEVKGKLIHLRLYPTDQKQPVEIDWIELAPAKGDGKPIEHWGFGAKVKAAINPADADTKAWVPVERTTEQIARVQQGVITDGGDAWQLDFYRNGAYKCGLSGHHTFLVIEPKNAAGKQAPLWVYFHGGGSGYFDKNGDYIALKFQNKDTYNHEESFETLRFVNKGQPVFKKGGFIDSNNTLCRRVKEGYRLLVIGYGDHDQYSGKGTPYPNNPEGGEVNGLQASMSAVEYTIANYPTTHVFAHGTSAGSAGAYALGFAFAQEGIDLTGVVMDSNINTPRKAPIGIAMLKNNSRLLPPKLLAIAQRDNKEKWIGTTRGKIDKIGVMIDPDYPFYPEAAVAAGFKSVPMLIVAGTNDPFFGAKAPVIAEAKAAGLGNVAWMWDGLRQAIDAQKDSPHKLLVIKAGHVPTVKSPGHPVNDEVDAFIQQVVAAGPGHPFEKSPR